MGLSACGLSLALWGCGGESAHDTGPSPGAAKQQLVFMWATVGHVGAAGPGVDYEIALINLDGTDFEQTLVTSGGENGYGTWSPDGTRIAYLQAARLGSSSTQPTTLITIDVDGTNPEVVGSASGAPNDWVWGDIAWSREDWILFVVGQTVEGSFCNSRIDEIRPDGSGRTEITDGGPDCTPPGKEAIGDADPGWSSDGQTIYSSRGFALVPTGLPASSLVTERKLYAVPSDQWVPNKPATDLSLPSEPACVEGVPKGSPDGQPIALFRACFDAAAASTPGVYITNTAGSYRRFVVSGFGPDWNPVSAN